MADIRYVIIFIVALYILSFFVFRWVHLENKKDDLINGRKKYWVLKYYWKKAIGIFFARKA